MYKRFVKRCLDFLLSLAALIILSPFFFLVAFLVRFHLVRPFLFFHMLPCLPEIIFFIYKFRTISSSNDADGNLLPA